MAVKDAKIPDHEKLPKDCIYYKHFLQVQMNKKLEKAAKVQIKEDRELLKEIGDGLSPAKTGAKEGGELVDPDEERGNKLVKKERSRKSDRSRRQSDRSRRSD